VSDLPRGKLVDGRYVVEGLLGRGGMAAVYLARHTKLGSYHAIKVLEIDRPSVRKRLVKEGTVQSKIKHHNVVSVTDAIDIDGRSALVMEYIHGPNLAAVVWNTTQAGKMLPLDHIDSLAAGLFDGLEVAHAMGVVHRDLKPHNVILKVDGHHVVAKIADFGLVKILDDDGDAQTRTNMFCGTPEYMAPEQARSAKGVDTRADLFSLGVVLYEMVAGERPFDGDDMVDIVNRVADGKRRPLAEVAPHAPPRILEAIEAALVVDREQRVQTVQALREQWFAGTTPAAPEWEPDWLLSLIDAVPEPAETQVEVPPPPMAQGSTLAPVTAAPTISEPPPAPGHVPWLPVVAGSLLALISGGIGLALFGSAMGMLLLESTRTTPAPEPVADVEPMPAPAPLPEPSPAPAPAPPPEPTPSPAPVAAPAAPVPTPAPDPAPVQPQPEPEPQPVPAPEPAPAPVVPPRITLSGADGITVVLRDLASGKTVQMRDATPGRYEVVAFFQPNTPTTIETLDLASGDDVQVRCTTSRCVVKP